MSVNKLITIEKLAEYLDKETSSLLLAKGVYDIGSYGWQSEDTEDPDYIGHAMWQVSPPFETEWEYFFDNVPVRHRPTEKQKLLSVAGNDFEGLMKASRLSLGLCLFHQSIAIQKPFDDNHYYWLHRTNSIIQLNMASDRIREYFTVAFFDKNEKTYNDTKGKFEGKSYRWYVTPFVHARSYCQGNCIDNKIAEAVSHLPEMSLKIHDFREIRNGIVHEISTKLGKMEKDLIEQQQGAFDSPSNNNGDKTQLNYQDLLEKQNCLNKAHEEELFAASAMLIAWYETLAKFSSHIFETEYWLRKSKPAPNKA